VGIWPWDCDDAILQYNEAYLTRTTRDGEGFDSDWFSHNTIIQYNYSHDNEGGFCLICAYGGYDGYNDGTIVRYNISQNDDVRAFHIAGPCTNTTVHNNTIYIGEGIASNPVDFSSWDGYADDTRFYNNVFYNLGSGDYYLYGATNTVFSHNAFYGNHAAGEPDDPHKLTSDPELVAPGSAGIGRDSCDGYRLRPTSPCIDSGASIRARLCRTAAASTTGAARFPQVWELTEGHMSIPSSRTCPAITGRFWRSRPASGRTSCWDTTMATTARGRP
jgi:hypothetical protein